MDIITIILLLITSFAASFIQSLCGFGSPIICMAALPYFMPYQTAISLSGLLTFTGNAGNVLSRIKYINIKLIIAPLIGYFAFAAAAILYSIDKADDLLTSLLGILLIILSLYFLFFNNTLKIKPTFVNGLIVGAVAGIMGGMFGIIAPPIVIYSMAVTKSKDEFITTNLTFGLVTNIYSTTIRAIKGAITAEVLLYWLLGSIAIVFGVMLGKKIVNKINGETMKKCVYIFMAISGAIMLI